MCDCYAPKCEGCNNFISIHVADFCTARKNVKVYCPDCLTKLPEINSAKTKVFIDHIEVMDVDCAQVFGGKENAPRNLMKKKRARYVGKPVVILVNDTKAYGVHLN